MERRPRGRLFLPEGKNRRSSHTPARTSRLAHDRDSGGLLLAVDLHYGVRRRVLSGFTLLADALKRFPHVRFVAGDVAERAVENALHGEGEAENMGSVSLLRSSG